MKEKIIVLNLLDSEIELLMLALLRKNDEKSLKLCGYILREKEEQLK